MEKGDPKTPKLKLPKPKSSQSLDLDDEDSDAMGGCSSVEDWENRNGRGFWGSSANGYVSDKNNK